MPAATAFTQVPRRTERQAWFALLDEAQNFGDFYPEWDAPRAKAHPSCFGRTAELVQVLYEYVQAESDEIHITPGALVKVLAECMPCCSLQHGVTAAQTATGRSGGMSLQIKKACFPRVRPRCATSLSSRCCRLHRD